MSLLCSSAALPAKVLCVWSNVPVACWEWEGKAGLRLRGTFCSLADSAQSLSPCLSVFVESLIKEPSALWGFTTSGSFEQMNTDIPLCFPVGWRWGMWECTHSCVPACEQVWTNPWVRAPTREAVPRSRLFHSVHVWKNTLVWRVGASYDWVFEAS